MKKYISTAILTICLFILETVNTDKCYECIGKENILQKDLSTVCQISVHFEVNKIWYAGALIFLNLLYFYYTDYKENNKTKKMLRQYLHRFFDNYLGGRNQDHRITVFRKRYGYQIFFRSLYHLFYRFKYYQKCNKLKAKLSKIPAPWSTYMVIYGRKGQPNEKFTSSVFKVTPHENEIDSFIAFIYHSGQVENVKLPNINYIDVDKFSNLEEVDNKRWKSLLDKYMTESKIENYNTLKLLGRRPKYLGGIPLFTKGAEIPSHIIMFDSDILDYINIKQEMFDFSGRLQILLSHS